jgi:hypothetical protein
MNIYGPQYHESFLMKIDINGVNKKTILRMPDTYDKPYLNDAAMDISLDGKLITYSPRFDGGIWVVNSDGTNNSRVVDLGIHPYWSADGKKITYENVRIFKARGCGGYDIWDNERGGISVIDLETKTITPITEDKKTHMPKWSPNGKYIAFQIDSVSGTPPQYSPGIMIYDINDKTFAKIEKAWSPLWGKCSNKLYYQTRGEVKSIYISLPNSEDEKSEEDTFVYYYIGDEWGENRYHEFEGKIYSTYLYKNDWVKQAKRNSEINTKVYVDEKVGKLIY